MDDSFLLGFFISLLLGCGINIASLLWMKVKKEYIVISTIVIAVFCLFGIGWIFTTGLSVLIAVIIKMLKEDKEAK